MICKVCFKERPKSFKMKGIRYIYFNPETKKQWLGRICPDCIAPYFKSIRSGLQISQKDCIICDKKFQPKRKAQIVCSLDCRKKYKCKQELNRQKQLR